MRKTIPTRPPKENLEEARRLSAEMTKKSIMAGITHEMLSDKTREISREHRRGNSSGSY